MVGRNAGLFLLRRAGWTNIAAARANKARPDVNAVACGTATGVSYTVPAGAPCGGGMARSLVGPTDAVTVNGADPNLLYGAYVSDDAE